MKKAITYYRISTERQGQSGLGLDAQKQAVKDFAARNDYVVIDEYVEVESGKRNDRPGLLRALEVCEARQATLLIAKLDRLGRNVLFISTLMESKVDFKAVDNPYASKLVVHIMAAFAEHERDMISERTKAALKAAKKKGVELGINGRYVLSKKNSLDAKLFAVTMKPIIKRLNKRGVTTMRGIADELNKLEVPTYRGGNRKWHPSTVHQLVQRIKESETLK